MEGNEIGLQLAGSKINFNRRDPSRIYNAVFASSNRSRFIVNFTNMGKKESSSTRTALKSFLYFETDWYILSGRSSTLAADRCIVRW